MIHLAISLLKVGTNDRTKLVKKVNTASQSLD